MDSIRIFRLLELHTTLLSIVTIVSVERSPSVLVVHWSSVRRCWRSVVVRIIVYWCPTSNPPSTIVRLQASAATAATSDCSVKNVSALRIYDLGS